MAEASRVVVLEFRYAGTTNVEIAGDFNGWVPDEGVRTMVAFEGSKQVWKKILRLPPGIYNYRLLVDGKEGEAQVLRVQ